MRAAMRFASLLGLAALLMACGSSNPQPTTPPAPSASAAPAAAGAAAPSAGLKAPGEAKIGDKTKCPISGEEFVVTADSPHAEHDGKTYYFCCPGCEKKFKSDPAKYSHGA